MPGLHWNQNYIGFFTHLKGYLIFPHKIKYKEYFFKNDIGLNTAIFLTLTPLSPVKQYNHNCLNNSSSVRVIFLIMNLFSQCRPSLLD